ncbi:MAG: hypothetical protein D6753_08785 [Planctomycetota bacterium]|nr:MAG: hypothetical protein D6753_08785 [Planctomycetota bacterium]
MPSDDRQLPDWYAVLEVPETATAEQIAAAFYALARRYHPDTSSAADPESRRFKQLMEAYEVLSDPVRRREYDRRRGGRRIPVSTPGPDAAAAWSHQGTHTSASQIAEGVIWADLPITPEESRWGGYCQLILRRPVPCSACSNLPADNTGGCSRCGGRRYVLQARRIGIQIPSGCRRGDVLRYQLPDPGNTQLCLRVKVRPCW